MPKTDSEQKQTDLPSRQVKEWTDTILQSIQSGVLVIDVESKKIIDINRAAEEMIGASREEIIGHICHDFVCPNKRDNCPITEKKQMVDNAECILLRKDGSEVDILKTVNPITFHGRACLIESFIDNSAHKRAEEAARAHQERFKTFFSSVNDAIFVHPLQKEGFAPFIEVNHFACQRYGYTRDEFLELTAADITKKSDASKHAAAAHRRKLLENRRLFFEAVHITRSGEEFPVEINSNIVEQFGKPVILAVVRDVSERKRAEQDKRGIEAQYRQSQKVEAIGRLAGGVAHDLNNLLTPIIGYGELLAGDTTPEDGKTEFAEHIVQAGNRARDLVRQLLAFGRRQTMEYRTADLNAIIENFRNLLRRTIREDIDIQINPTDNLPPVNADVGQIEQVIMNLCVNAQDAMPEGGVLKLETALKRSDNTVLEKDTEPQVNPQVILSISDTGIGMNEEIQDHIFEPFYSTKGAQGTGLGLSTVYGIIKQHDGNIEVASRVGSGTTFTIQLPVSQNPIEQAEPGAMQEAGPESEETILLVEDDQPVRQLSGTVLKRQGYTILSAENGAEALSLVEDHHGPLDLILTDVVMPGINGKELYSRISVRHPEVKVLYMSGYTDDVIVHHGVLDQGIHFIQKPFSLKALSTKIREVLDG